MRRSVLKNLWNQISIRLLVKSILLAIFGWIIFQAIHYFQGIIVILCFASIIALLLHQPTRYLSRFLPYYLAAILVFLSSLLILVTLLVGIGLKVISQGQEAINQMTIFIQSIASFFGYLQEFLNKQNIDVNLNAVQSSIQNQLFVAIHYVISNLQLMLQNLLGLIITLVIAFFILLEGEKLWQSFLYLLPENQRTKFTKIIRDSFFGFFLGQLLLGLFFVITSFIVFIFLQAPFPLLLAFIGGVFGLIPGIGATLGGSIITLILLAQNAWLALKALIAFIIIQQIQDNLLAPKIMQNTINISPVAAFFALLIGAKIAGLLGIFIALPIAGIIESWLKINSQQNDIG